MKDLETFEQFLSTASTSPPVLSFLFNLALAGLMSLILGLVYIRYGYSLSNRQSFARNFILITMTTMLIIAIVKSSLALSLGLVGALSIVRFRTAIKDPEELAFMFIAIAMGLGFGADQRAITLLAFVVIVAAIVLSRRRTDRIQDQNLHITVVSHALDTAGLDAIVENLRQHSTALELKRLDERGDSLEAAFRVEFKDFDQLNRAKDALRRMDASIAVSYLDNLGVA